MRTIDPRRWLPALAMALAIAAAAPASANVGLASVVQGEPKGRPPSQAERVLKIGNDLQADERVTTMANDRAHIVFLDGTSLTVGPNSAVVLDKFVFDPNRGVGEMSLSTLKGSMRFVGGLVSKTSTVTVNAPTSTMGIRGGIAIITISPSGVTTAALLFGLSLTVTSQGVTQTATSNFQITVEPGKPPSPPVPIPPGGPILLSILELGGAASSPTTPADGLDKAAISLALSDSGLAEVNSNIAPEAALAAIAAQHQAQWSFGIGVRLNGGAAPVQTAAAAGQPPLGTSSRPLESTDPPANSGPLHMTGPLQSTGPLQGMGPLVPGLPLQDIGPVQLPDFSGVLPDQPGSMVDLALAPPDYQPPALTPEQLATLGSGNVAAMNQLVAQLLANGQATPATLQQIIDLVSSSPVAETPPSAISQPSGPTGSTSGQLPPTVYQPPFFVSGS